MSTHNGDLKVTSAFYDISIAALHRRLTDQASCLPSVVDGDYSFSRCT